MNFLFSYYIYSTFFFFVFFGLLFIFYKKNTLLNFLDMVELKNEELRQYIIKTDFDSIIYLFKNLIILLIPFFRIIYLIEYINLTFFPKKFEKAYLSSHENRKILDQRKEEINKTEDKINKLKNILNNNDKEENVNKEEEEDDFIEI